MKSMLFPHCFQRFGWAVFAVSALLGIYILAVDFASSCLLNNIVIIGVVAGAILATCSCEKVEDEMVRQVRLGSLLVALYVNYAALIICSLFIYDLDFLYVMMCNMFTMLIVFMVVFRYRMWCLNKGMKGEEQD